MNQPRLIPIIVATTLIAACGNQGETSDNTPAKVLVKMRGNEITESDFAAEINKISPFAKNQFSGAEGKRRMLERMVQNELLYTAAREKGYQNSAEVREQLEEYERNLLIREFYRSEVQERVVVDEAAISGYYDENQDKYVEKARVKVRHVLCETSEDADAIRKELLSGADFRAIAREKSKDKLSSRRDGLLGNIIQNGYIPTVGKDEAIQEILFAMGEGEISEPVESRKGHHIFLVEERTEGRTKDLEEVQDLIKGELKREMLSAAMEATLEELHATYSVEYQDAAIEGAEDPDTDEFEFELEENQETADEAQEEAAAPGALDGMLQAAAEERDPKAAIASYEEILRRFPGDPAAYKARFMIGFVCSEQLGDADRAVAAYKKVLEDYPDCDLAESARYMIRELDGENTSYAGSRLTEVFA